MNNLVQAKITFSDECLYDVHQTIEAIAPDVLPMCECNEDLIECALDADRVLTFGSKESNDELKVLYKQHGFRKVVQALAKRGDMSYV